MRSALSGDAEKFTRPVQRCPAKQIQRDGPDLPSHLIWLSGDCNTWSLVCAPFVIVTRWRIILPSFNAVGCDRAPIHLDEIDVPIHKPNHVIGVIKVRGSMRFMPSIW